MPLSVSNLTGFGSWNNITVVLPTTLTPTDTVTYPTVANASLAITSSGTGTSTGEGNFNWARPAFTGVGADYEVQMTVSSGEGFSAGSSATDTWLSLDTSRAWHVVRDAAFPGSTSTVGLLLIRRKGSTVSEGTCVPSFTATQEADN